MNRHQHLYPTSSAPTMLGRVFVNLYGAIGIAAGLFYVLGG
ncbi:MAG TPA: hypothetical protein VE568_09580 [Rubrobacter sp.]|nr:hypothetical protein [Rubrobacter sp.]